MWANLLPLLGLESDGGGLEGSAVGGVAGVLHESQEGRGGGGPFSRGAFPLWSDEGLRKMVMQTADKSRYQNLRKVAKIERWNVLFSHSFLKFRPTFPVLIDQLWIGSNVFAGRLQRNSQRQIMFMFNLQLLRLN